MLFDFSARTEVYFRKGVVASRPDHFKRSLRFKGFLNLAISDSVNDGCKIKIAVLCLKIKQIPHTPMGLLSWFKRFRVKADVLTVEFQPHLEMVHGKYHK